MADYPYYGQNYGTRDQSTQPSYLPQNYQNTAYNNFQQDDSRAGQSIMNQAYDNALSTYYNQQHMPTYSAPAAQPNIPQIPSFQGWNQDTMSMSQYNTAPQSIHSYGGYNQQNYSQNSQYYAPVATPTQAPYQSQTAGYGNAASREMSEGEFDDNSANVNNTSAIASMGAQGRNFYRGNDGGNGYLDTAHRAVYPQSHDPSPQQPPALRSASDYYTSSTSQDRRQPSGSYSPYIPQEDSSSDQQSKPSVKNSSSTPKKVAEKKKGGQQFQTATNGAGDSNTVPKHNGAPIERQLPSLDGTNQGGDQNAVQSQSDTNSEAVAFKTVAEARKKAEGAILNLWSYDIRFPAYIEEGVDEKLVGELFDELRLSRTASKTLNGSFTQQSPSKVSSAPTSSVGGGQSSTQTSIQNVSTADKGKQAATNGIVPPVPAAAPPTKTAAAAEKEKIMQMKMEALRKSREERAQKNAAKSGPTAPAKITSPVVPSKPSGISSEQSISTSISTSLPGKFTQTPMVDRTIPNDSSNMPAPAPSALPAELSKPPNQPVTPLQTSQIPTIPGLFRASAIMNPIPSPVPQSSMAQIVPNNQRKRPVAADFDSPSNSSPYKRPFGQSRNEQQPFVIDVSEDEDESDEDVAMDLESRADTESPVQATQKISDQRILPVLSNMLPQKPFTPPPISSISTPPLPPPSATKPIIGNPEDLRRKESEIEQLKRKIAEAEQRKKAKKASSGAQTPNKSESNASTGISINGDLANKIESSVEMQKVMNTTQNKLSIDHEKLVQAQASEKEKVAEIQQKEAENKRSRLERIANAIPRVDAEALSNQLKLEQLRAETARVEAAIQKNLQDKQKLAEEMERLSREAEHQIQEQKEKLDNLTREEIASNAAPSRPASTHPIKELETQQTIEEPEDCEKSPSVPMDIDEKEGSVEPASEPLNAPQTNAINTVSPEPIQTTNINQESTNEASTDGKDDVNSDRALEAALQEAARADAESPGASDVEMEESMPSTAVDSDKGEGSPDYSPVLERAQVLSGVPGAIEVAEPEIHSAIESEVQPAIESEVQPAIESEVQAAIEAATEAATETDAEIESDNYEPPEATPPVEETSVPESPPFSPAPPTSAKDESEEVEMVEISNGNVNDDETGSNSVEEALPQQNASVTQLTETQVPSSSNNGNFFTPYESPLKRFHAFRFHPEFKQQVSGGLKSMTYTHRIDPNKELCRYELMGGICNDHSCDLQHFREMGLPDDAILTTLGSPDEFDGPQREKFIEGLKQVLSGLRARKIKDFDVIASEIVAHRSKFLGDPSKVLMLEGTTI